jgi:hypothetical protein
MLKPTLIISCSAAKASTSMPAFDLYRGGMFSLIRANLINIHEHFNVLILSALHGLIDSQQRIQPYNVTIPTNPTGIRDFVLSNKVTAVSNLAKYASEKVGVFVILPNNYLTVLDELLAQPSFKNVFNRYQSQYISRQHSGIGVLRRRLKCVLNYARNESQVMLPILFRSGLSNDDEIIGMRHTTQDVGASLAYVSDIKRPDLLNYFVTALYQGRSVF